MSEGRDEKGRFTEGNNFGTLSRCGGGRPSVEIDNMTLSIKCICCNTPQAYHSYPPDSKMKIGVNRKCYGCRSKSYHPLTKSVKSRINSALRNNDSKKKSTTIDLLGINIESYKNYLEKRFTKKMNWDNYGSYWEIDHIIPLSKFNLNNTESQKQAFHYTNTQPLTVKQNRSKNNRTKVNQYKLRI